MFSRAAFVALTLFFLAFAVGMVHAVEWRDDFSGGLQQPWLFLDDVGDSPPSSTAIEFGTPAENLIFLGDSEEYENEFNLNLSATGYVGLGDDAYFFPGDVFVTATVSPLEQVNLDGESSFGNNDSYVVGRGDGLDGYIVALDAHQRALDLVRVDDGVVAAFGETAIARDIEGVDEDGTYVLEFSAIGDLLTGELFDTSMNSLATVFFEDDTYESGWTGLGAAINDDGFENEGEKTLIATAFDNFSARDTREMTVEPVGIDELTTAVRAGSTDSRFDLDGSGTVDDADRAHWVQTQANTFFGDANLDGEFNSSDFVVVFQTGEYEDETAGNSVWGTGDWNGDGDFDSGDFVLAFQGGGYEQGPRPAPAAVPEPSSIVLLLIGVVGVMRRRTRSIG